jgi:eukaryotic-like serine/threonine-protein kinase
MVGRTVGNLQIVEKLGEGGMGSVYRAVDQMVQRNVAIKVLKPEHAGNPEVYERFHTEAVALARLNHPAIATLYSFFREGNEYFMVMEFVPGKSLDHVIQTRGALGWPYSCAILLRVLDGMRHAHAQGIIHRDLKPGNIMLTPEGVVKVTDFGIARMFYAPKLTRDQGVIGTVEYLAPERILGQDADARSDVYSLGVVFYEIATGRLPFHATTEFELMRAQVEQRPSSFAELGISMPPEVESAVLRSLEKDPQRRPQNATMFTEGLSAALIACGAQLPDLAGAFNLGAKETSTSFVPKATVFAGTPTPSSQQQPKETVYVQPQPRETAYVQPPRETAYVQPPRETAYVQPPRETAYVQPARETAYVQPARETVVVPRSPATPPPARLSPKLLWAIPALLLSLGLGVFGFRHFSKQPPTESAGTQTASNGQLVTASGPTLATQPSPSTPPPQPLPADPAPDPAPVKPDVTPAVTPAPVKPPPVKPAVKPDVKPPAPVQPAEVQPESKPEPVRPADPRPAPAAPEPAAESSSVKRLVDVKTLYLRPGAASEFDDFLRERLHEEMGTRFTLATSAASADAVMVVTIEDQHGNVVSGTAGRAFGLKGARKATVIIQDRSGKHRLWSAVIDDRHSLATAMRDDMKRLASRIAKRLRSDLR